jgi:predicted ATPase
MIKHVRIQNFKSLTDVSVDLDPVTVLIGRSGTGKSNFVQALCFLRDYLKVRNTDAVQQFQGGWDRLWSATTQQPMTISFELLFSAPGISGDYSYTLKLRQHREGHVPQLTEEALLLDNEALFHQSEGRWLVEPRLARSPGPGQLMLGGLTGLQEVTIAHLVLTAGIGCYRFPDDVLTVAQAGRPDAEQGLDDGGRNYLRVFNDVAVNLTTWQHLRDMASSLRRLKPSLKSIELAQPQRTQVVVSHAAAPGAFVFDISQESEGFRRLLACLLALYQASPKQTLIFDEPEKGIYPAGLAILADEFKGYASKGRGQVLLTTHSPEFLDSFEPEQIRVVEMRDLITHIGPVAPEQLDSLRERFLKPSDLLTTDEGRLAGSLVEAG